MKKSSFFFLFLAASLLFLACERDPDGPDDDHNDEGEVITTLTLTFMENGNTTVFSFKDPDGDGGNAPTVFETITLNANTQYTASATLLNESDPNDVEDITVEIQAEDDEHIFCYTPDGADVNIARTDTDGTYEVGLETTWDTGAAGSGTVKVVLKHQPGVKDGNCDPGETDIEVDFPVTIQ